MTAVCQIIIRLLQIIILVMDTKRCGHHAYKLLLLTFKMNARLHRMLDKALALDHDERWALITILLDNLEIDSPKSVANDWADEIRKRKSELESGVTTPTPWFMVRARIQNM